MIEILHLLQEDPHSTLYGGEDLKHFDPSRRSFELTKKDRVVISIEEEEHAVYIYQYIGHYQDN